MCCSYAVVETAYTYSRRPVKLVWNEEVAPLGEALTHERQIKGWNRAQKEALIHEIVREERKRRKSQTKRLRQKI